jgi:rubrerythrin
MKTLSMRLGSILVVVLGLICTAAATPHSRTLWNLQRAFCGESNAHARYQAFAFKADQEGYGAVASLFRAAAKAEEIHASNHAAVIRSLGGTPHATIQIPEVKSTRENLEAAIKGETYERDVMYPRFISAARNQHLPHAVVTFQQAQTAEAEHAKLFKSALGQLDELRGSTSRAYYVCPVCGYTVRQVDFDNCPSCLSPKSVYQPVS